MQALRRPPSDTRPCGFSAICQQRKVSRFAEIQQLFTQLKSFILVTMPVVLNVSFPFTGPYGDAALQAMKELAESISTEVGLKWKIWTESEERKEAGGVYCFEDRGNAERYLDFHSKRLAGFGIKGIRSEIWEVNEGLSKIDRAPIF